MSSRNEAGIYFISLGRMFSVRARGRRGHQGERRTGVEGGTKPYQPHPKHIETQKLSKRVLSFQEKWFQEYTWLHYNPQVKGVLCFYCNEVFTDNRSSFGKKVDVAFVTEGFRNWKKALEIFAAHQKIYSHCHAVTVNAHDSNPVSVQLSSSWAKQQEEARHSLLRIVSSVQYLAR